MTVIDLKTVSFVNLLPPALIIYLIALFSKIAVMPVKTGIQMLFYCQDWIPVPLMVYASVLFLNSCYLAYKNKENIITVPELFVLSLTAHLSYGLGFFMGIFKSLKILLEKIMPERDCSEDYSQHAEN